MNLTSDIRLPPSKEAAEAAMVGRIRLVLSVSTLLTIFIDPEGVGGIADFTSLRTAMADNANRWMKAEYVNMEATAPLLVFAPGQLVVYTCPFWTMHAGTFKSGPKPGNRNFLWRCAGKRRKSVRERVNHHLHAAFNCETGNRAGRERARGARDEQQDCAVHIAIPV